MQCKTDNRQRTTDNGEGRKGEIVRLKWLAKGGWLWRWCGLSVVVLMVLSVVGEAAAQARPGPDSRDPCSRREGALTPEDREAVRQIYLKRVQARLGLSDEQARDIEGVLRSVRDESRADIQALCEARVELRRLLERQDSDPAALKATADRIKAIQAKLLDRRLETQLSLRGKLTPEQWAKWIELRKGMARRWGGRGPGLSS
jgi:Spy/CpxP family protein refolding chaperone